MFGIVLALLLFAVAIPYFATNLSNRLLLVYPLILYLMLWPKVFDQMGTIQAKGEFGSIQISDVFYLLFSVLMVGKIFSADLMETIRRHWLPLMAAMLYLFYWLFHVFVLSQGEAIRASLNQFRYLAYYLFLLFLLLRIRDEEDVRNVLRVSCSIAIPAVLLTIVFFFLHSTGFIRSLLRPFVAAYKAYMANYSHDMRFDVFNIKCYFMLIPFLLTIPLFDNLFPKWPRVWQLTSLCCAVFLLIVDQSRAILLITLAGFVLAMLLLGAKGVVVSGRILKVIPLGAILAGTVIVLLLLGGTFAPGLSEKITKRLSSISITGIEDYKKNKEMDSLNSRIESYTYLISRLGDDYLFGKGLGTKINPFGTFKRFVDSTFLMNVWSGGLMAVFLLLLFLTVTLWVSWTGYLKAKEPFDVYFFTSSTVSLVAIYINALQDNILFFGNSVIMFLVLASMVFAQSHELNKKLTEEACAVPGRRQPAGPRLRPMGGRSEAPCQ